MLGKILCAGLLSAALIAVPKPSPAQLNNLATKQDTQQVQAQLTSKHDEASPQPAQPTEEVAVAKPSGVEPETPQSQAKPVVHVLTGKEQLMQAAGIPESDWGAVDYIVSHESSWRVQATNPDSNAYGLCQALPASKMARAGPDWKDNPVTQLKWCHAYATDRYGSWWKAHAFWQAARWW